MSAFIFVLIQNQEAKNDIQAWQKGLQRKGKEAYEVLMNLFPSGPGKGFSRHLGFRCLAKLRPSDKLYVYSHFDGTPGARIGTDRNDGSTKSYSATELAALLENEGLPKSFLDLRLYACETGLGDEPFALRLKNALVERGYRHIGVTGYLGEVRPSYAFRQTPDGDYTDQEHKGIDINGYIFRASSFRRRF
jgi:hypothetical protein